jgi:hypothetical protein
VNLDRRQSHSVIASDSEAIHTAGMDCHGPSGLAMTVKFLLRHDMIEQ